MLRTMRWVPSGGVLSLALAFGGCGSEEDPATDGSAGEDGSGATSGMGGTSGTGGTSSGCAEGTGTVVVEVEGLPASVEARVSVSGPAGNLTLSGAVTNEGVAAGDYAVTATRVTDFDSIVRTVYDAEVSDGEFCLEDGASHTVTVRYRAIPSSNKLWTSSARGFGSASLEVSGEVEPSVAADAPIGKDVAFDRDGNLWSFGATLAEPMIVRVPAENLAESADNGFDREIDVPEIECLPATRAMAFDPAGNLWVAACGGQVLKLDAESLVESGEVSSASVFSEVDDPGDLAFDRDGNLWVASAAGILRYDAERLEEGGTDPADLVLSPRRSDDSADLDATGLAFDAEGDLWGFDFGGNYLFELGAADLSGSGEQEVVSRVSFVVSVTTLVNRGAFDEGGGLWLSYEGNRLARFSPSQLGVSGDAGDPVSPERLVESPDLDSDLRLAFFPAPAALPLYHTAFAPE